MRYLAQRYGTWEWLHLELPLDSEGPEWVLSSYGIMTASVAPDLGLQTAEDGRPVLEEWGTLIHAETGDGADRRRWTGIVVRSELQGKSWAVTVWEFPGYLKGTPIEALIRGVNADPAELLRQVWQEVQSFQTSWLGVTVTGSTPVRVGTDSDDKVAAARATMDARKKTLDQLSKTKTEKTSELQDLTKTLSDEVAQARTQVTAGQQVVNALIASGAPAAQIESARQAVASRQATLQAVLTAYQVETGAGKSALTQAKTDKDAAQGAYDQAKDAYQDAVERARSDGGAYELRPEDVPDAHRSVTDLCTVSGMEWTTRTRHSDGPPVLEIVTHYPSAGRRRDDLLFEQGVNIVSELQLVRDGEEYANAGLGVGAGEGPEAVRRSIASQSPRLRRVAIVEDRSLRTAAQVEAVTRAEVRRRSGNPYVPEVEVVDHPLAPMFSWSVGDHILIQGDVPHYGRFSALHRIVSWRLVAPHKAVLRLRLSSTL